MQARYYDPAVGRFTQLDPVRYGPETFATGQSNRWTYCANDPVNASDPSGNNPFAIALGIVMIAAFAIGLWAGYSAATTGLTPGGFLVSVLGAFVPCLLVGRPEALPAFVGLLLSWQVALGFLGYGSSVLGPIIGIGLIGLATFFVGFVVGYIVGTLFGCADTTELEDSRKRLRQRRTRELFVEWNAELC